MQAHRRNHKALKPKGINSVINILEASKSILIKLGYSQLSMRKVAQEANITVGNLSYYYPSKDSLVNDLLDRIVNDYLDHFDALRREGGGSEQQFISVVSYWLDDLRTKQTTVFFPELWAMSNHHEYVAQVMDNLYTQVRATLYELIGNINPTLSAKQKKVIALYLSSAMEGQTMFVGYQKSCASDFEILKRLTIKNFLELVKNPHFE